MLGFSGCGFFESVRRRCERATRGRYQRRHASTLLLSIHGVSDFVEVQTHSLVLGCQHKRFCNKRECARAALPGRGLWRKATGSEGDIAYSSAACLVLVELTNLSRIHFSWDLPLAPFSPTASGKRPANTLNTESFMSSPSCTCDRVRRRAPPNREGRPSRHPVKDRSKGGQRQRIPPGAECPRCHPISWSLH